jgi:transcriptional repressor of dcmA and dcmR
MKDPNELLDIAGAAAFLNVSETSLRRWTNSGRLACLRLGLKRERRFRRADLLAFMEDQPRLDVSAAAAAPRHEASDSNGSNRGRHLCGVYETPVGIATLVAPFLLEGLQEGSICFLIASPRVRSDLVKFLTSKRKSLANDIKAGRLVLAPYRNSGDEQCDYFQAQFESAMANGARSFRVVGDVGMLRAKTSSTDVLHYEASYDERIARRYPVNTLCAYDARGMTGIEILDALKGHPDIGLYPLDRVLA